jgi:hypothetical protein
MLKFFRTIRKKLIEHLAVGQAGDNVQKPVSPAGRYLLYAIGEILLIENMYERVGNNIEDQFQIYNRHIKAHTNAETLDIRFTYDESTMVNNDEFINTFSRMSVHWSGLVYFLDDINRRARELKEKMGVTELSVMQKPK